MRASYISQVDLLMERDSLEKAVKKLCGRIKTIANKQKRMEKDFVGVRGGRTKLHYKHYDSSTKRIVVCEQYSFPTSKKFKREMAEMQAAKITMIGERNKLQCQLNRVLDLIKTRA